MKGGRWWFWTVIPGGGAGNLLASLAPGWLRETAQRVGQAIASGMNLRVVVVEARTRREAEKALDISPTQGRATFANPTLVHHGMIRLASHHILESPGGDAVPLPLADLYAVRQKDAEKIAQALASGLRIRVMLLDNAGTPASLAAHPMQEVGPLARRQRRIGNPITPVKGEVWSKLGGDKVKILDVSRTTVQVRHLTGNESGNRDWIERREFTARYKPPRRSNPCGGVRNRKGHDRAEIERGMFGMTLAEVEGYLTPQVRLEPAGWVGLAAAMLSDTQHLIANDEPEAARQLLNRVKWVLFNKVPRQNPRRGVLSRQADKIACAACSRVRHNPGCPCDPRCCGARGRVCECRCRGANHQRSSGHVGSRLFANPSRSLPARMARGYRRLERGRKQRRSAARYRLGKGSFAQLEHEMERHDVRRIVRTGSSQARAYRSAQPPGYGERGRGRVWNPRADRPGNDRDFAAKTIRDALKRRSGHAWSVTVGRGTAWGWIGVTLPPSRRTWRHRLKPDMPDWPENYEGYDSGQPGGGMSPDQRAELAGLLGLEVNEVHGDGISIPGGSDYYDEYMDRAQGRTPERLGKPYWDNPRERPPVTGELARIMAEVDRDRARDLRRTAARKGIKPKSLWLEMTGLHPMPKPNARGGPRIVFNRLLGGWYVVVGPHQTPLNGRFNSKAEAQAWLEGGPARRTPNPAIHFDRRSLPDIAQRVVAAAFPSYRGNKFQLAFADSIRVDNLWSGGSKEDTVFVRLDTMQVYRPPDTYQAGAQEAPIPDGVVAVQHVMFTGTDLGIRFVVPSSAARLFPPPEANATQDELIVLDATRSYKSSYGGVPDYRFKEAASYTGISRDRWEAARAALIGKRMLNRAGAITAEGRTAVGDFRLDRMRRPAPNPSRSSAARARRAYRRSYYPSGRQRRVAPRYEQATTRRQQSGALAHLRYLALERDDRIARRTPNPKGRAVIDSEWKARREARRKWGRGAQVWSGGVVGNKTFVVGVLTHAGSAFQAIGSGDSWEAAFTDAKGKRRPKPNPKGRNPRSPFQVGERVTVPYTGPASVFGRKVARTREHATIQGVNDDGTVLVLVKRGRGHEQHTFPAAHARRLPQRGVKATGARVGRAKARLELKDLRARQRAATGEVGRLAAEAECLEARAKLMDPETPEYRNATARLGRLLTVLDAERMIAGELERADPSYADPFALPMPARLAPNPKGRKNPAGEAWAVFGGKYVLEEQAPQTYKNLGHVRLFIATGKRGATYGATLYEDGRFVWMNLAMRNNNVPFDLAQVSPARLIEGATRTNPRSSEVAKARAMFERWNSDAAPRAPRTSRVRVPAQPRALARLGELVAVTYRSDKFAGTPDNPDGRQQLYEHETKRPRPVLASDGDGHLHIVGGRMRPTADGLIN